MKAPLTVLLLLGFLVSCQHEEETVQVTETRRKTTKDLNPKLFASSDERFRDVQPAPVQADLPEGWLKLPGTKFRLLNYRFGESGLGQVYVSISQGSLLENLNRWRQQFGQSGITADQLGQLEKVTLLGTEGVWVTTSGVYEAGMGQEEKLGYGLAGVMAEAGGNIITIKMVGPAKEVEAEHAELRAFAASLRPSDN